MPVIKQDAVIYRPDLGAIVMAYSEEPQRDFIGLEVMPIFPVTEQSGTHLVIPREALLGLPDVSRAPRGHYQRGDWEAERGIYATKEHGWEEPVDDVERRLFDQETPGAADLIATKRAWNHIMRHQEKRVADIVFDASTFSATSAATAWASSAATVIDNVNTGKLAMRAATGMIPDVLIITWPTMVALRQNAEIKDRLRYTYPGQDINALAERELAAIFDVPRVLVGKSVYNSAGKGLDAVITDIWDNSYAALVKISSGPDLRQVGFGRTFLWTEDSPQNPIVEQYREEETRSDVFRVRHNVDERPLRSLTDAGVVVSDIADASIYLIKIN